MDLRLRITVMLSALAFTGYTIELIRRHKLREEYALLWLGLGGLMLTLAVFRDLVDVVAKVLGVAYPPSALFMVALYGALFGFLHMSVVLSEQSDKIRTLAQEVAMLRYEVSYDKAVHEVAVSKENKDNA